MRTAAAMGGLWVVGLAMALSASGCSGTDSGSAKAKPTSAKPNFTMTPNFPPSSDETADASASDASVGPRGKPRADEPAQDDPADASVAPPSEAPPLPIVDASVPSYFTPPRPDGASDDSPDCRPFNAAQVCVPFFGEKQPCGSHSDGCMGTLDCGLCSDGSQVCYEGACCSPDPSCESGGKVRCGKVSDGCGGQAECPSCAKSGDVCHEGLCCTPSASCEQNGRAQCGKVPDGCGGQWDCGGCGTGDTCYQGLCCTPSATCEKNGKAQCGQVADGCGGQWDCGGCSQSGDVCVSNACCTPHPVCTSNGRQMCGVPVDDGCGRKVPCPACEFGKCGGGGLCSCVVDPSRASACSSGKRAVVCASGELPGGSCDLGDGNVWCCR